MVIHEESIKTEAYNYVHMYSASAIYRHDLSWTPKQTVEGKTILMVVFKPNVYACV